MVEGVGLENRKGGITLEGSNPSLSSSWMGGRMVMQQFAELRHAGSIPALSSSFEEAPNASGDYMRYLKSPELFVGAFSLFTVRGQLLSRLFKVVTNPRFVFCAAAPCGL